MKNSNALFGLALLIGLGLLLGCGPSNPPTYKVSGVVSLDGQPVPGATITFIPEMGTDTQPAVGTSDHEGKYSLTTFVSGDGAMKGMYTVTVMKVQTEAGQSPYDAYRQSDAKSASSSSSNQSLEDMYAAYGNSYTGPPEDAGKVRQPASKDLVPARYKSKESSGIRFPVSDSGANNIDLVLTSK
ncbi:carboxypeptidase-like regulatory domain-containing protein [Pirellulaceae bacterium SH449]